MLCCDTATALFSSSHRVESSSSSPPRRPEALVPTGRHGSRHAVRRGPLSCWRSRWPSAWRSRRSAWRSRWRSARRRHWLPWPWRRRRRDRRPVPSSAGLPCAVSKPLQPPEELWRRRGKSAVAACRSAALRSAAHRSAAGRSAAGRSAHVLVQRQEKWRADLSSRLMTHDA